MPTTCAVASSEHPIAVQAAGEAAEGVAQRLGEAPDLALLFVTAPHVASFGAAVDAVRDLVKPRALAAITAVSVVGGPRELEQRPAVSLFGARFDGADGADRPVALRLPAGNADLAVQQLAEAGIDPHGPHRILVLLPDPFTFPVEEFLEALHKWAPGITVVGGMASAARAPGGNRLALDGDVFVDGAVAVLLPVGVATSAIVSQGCRPIGDPMVVTKADGTLVEELASEPALPKLMKLITSFSESDRALAAQGLHLGRVVDEGKENHERGDFLVRNVLGAIKDRAALAVGDEIGVGTTVQFQVRDAESADEDLKALLADRTASGALLFTCNGRGTHLFGTPDHDAALVDAMASGATAGMFCAGEVGPVGGRAFVHGFTASILLFD